MTRKKRTCECTPPPASATHKKSKIVHVCVICRDEVEETEVFPCCQSRVCAPCLTRWNALATNRAAGCIVCRQTESAFVITWAAWHACPAALRPHLLRVSEWILPVGPGAEVLLHKALRVRWDAPSLVSKTQQMVERKLWEEYTFVLSPVVTVRVLDAGPAAISDPNLWNLRIKNEDGEMAAAMPRFPLPPPPALRRRLLLGCGRVHLLAPVTAAGASEAVRRVLRALREDPASAVEAETCRVHAMRDHQLWSMLTLRVGLGAGDGHAPPAWGPALDAALEEPAWRAGIPPALLPRNQRKDKENEACQHVLHYVAPPSPAPERDVLDIGLTLNTYCPPGTAFSTFVDMAEREMNAVLPRVVRVMLGMPGRRNHATPTMQVTLGKRITEPRPCPASGATVSV